MLKSLPVPRRVHLAFSLLMAAAMVFLVTFVITSVNLGWQPDFLAHWAKAFALAYVIVAPMIFFVAPWMRRVAERLVHGRGEGKS